jgi:hypothetical protein
MGQRKRPFKRVLFIQVLSCLYCKVILNCQVDTVGLELDPVNDEDFIFVEIVLYNVIYNTVHYHILPFQALPPCTPPPLPPFPVADVLDLQSACTLPPWTRLPASLESVCVTSFSIFR